MRFFVLIVLIINKVYIIDCVKEPGTFSRIIKGRDTTIGEFPYAVRLETDSSWCCGSLISPIWVLTAAHCVVDSGQATVYLGSNVRNSDEVVYHVPSNDIKIHPRFDEFLFRNDIALVKIPFTHFNEKISIVPLPRMRTRRGCLGIRSKFNYENASAIVCGWGKTSKDGLEAKILQLGRFRIMNARECRCRNISKKQLCTAASSDLATVWDGDSGAPLVLETTGELVGIASGVGRNSCNNGYNSLFTCVTSYLDWIKSVSGIC